MFYLVSYSLEGIGKALCWGRARARRMKGNEDWVKGREKAAGVVGVWFNEVEAVAELFSRKGAEFKKQRGGVCGGGRLPGYGISTRTAHTARGGVKQAIARTASQDWELAGTSL